MRLRRYPGAETRVTGSRHEQSVESGRLLGRRPFWLLASRAFQRRPVAAHKETKN
jgi:hypothetical protein